MQNCDGISKCNLFLQIKTLAFARVLFYTPFCLVIFGFFPQKQVFTSLCFCFFSVALCFSQQKICYLFKSSNVGMNFPNKSLIFAISPKTVSILSINDSLMFSTLFGTSISVSTGWISGSYPSSCVIV